MKVLAIARPYAKAAFEWASEAKALTEWEGLLHRLALFLGDDRVVKALSDPAVTPEKAVKFVMCCVPQNQNAAFERFVTLLANNHRLIALPAIYEQFGLLKKESEQVVDVELITAVVPQDHFIQKIKSILASRFNKAISLQQTVEPAILGGAVIKVADTVIDGSVKGKLARIAGALIS